jgi:pimeloyl-ACP methyl ester carboxylesterase
MVKFRNLIAGSFVLCSSLAAQAAPSTGLGEGMQIMRLNGFQMEIFTYRPRCLNPSLLIVLHGMGRNAKSYRDSAIPLGEELCMFIAAPEFDRQRFANWSYQHGGIVHQGQVQSAENWTGHLVVELARQLSHAEGRPMRYSLIGHSGGGQFLSRLAAFVPTSAERIVLANPGTLVFPSLDVSAPYGLGGVYADPAASQALRQYLARPITIFLGEGDVHEKNLDMGPEAMAQGGTRLERGVNAFRAAQALARAYGWEFHWRLVEAAGVGHSARKMFASPEVLRALRP